MFYTRGNTGGWAFGHHAKGSSGTDRGGFGWLGSTDALSYYYIGPAYNAATMYIFSGSNFASVGIGTSTLTYSAANRGTLEINGTSDSILTFKSSDTARMYLYSSATENYVLAIVNPLYLWTNAAQPIQFFTNATEKMRILSDGKVGIGTTSPSRLLQVGAVTLSPSPDADANIVSSGGIIIAGGKWLTLDAAYQDHARIRYNSANVASEIAMDIDSYYGINFQTRSGTSRMVIRGDTGNVGIGTTTPGTYNLYVNGNTYANGIILGNDSSYGSPYKVVGFNSVNDGGNRIFAATTTADGMYFAAATGRGFSFRPNGANADLIVIDRKSVV
jgi:hypothetical protein